MSIPNLLNEVEAARQKYPEAWRNAHTGGPGTEDFVRLLARDVRATHGTRWGINGKRGNPNDISDDILAYSGEGTAIDVLTGGPMEIIDIIGGAGGPNPQPAWNVGPGGPGDRGAFVGTFTVPDGGVVTPPSGSSSWEAKHATRLTAIAASRRPQGILDAAFVRWVAEDFAFAFPSDGWCCKAASAGRPPSGDVIGRKGAQFVGYKIVPLPVSAPAEIDLTGQQVLSVVAQDHLGTPGPTPPIQPPVTPPVQPPAPSVKPYVGDAKANKLSDTMDKDYRRGGHEHGLNAGAGQWFGQIYHDYYAGMEWDAAVNKHRAVWCSILGVTPD